MSSIASSSRSALTRIAGTRPPSVQIRPHPISASPLLQKSLSRHFRYRRYFATEPSRERGWRVSYLFGGLASLGLLVTIYGLLEYYYSLQTWPEPIRTPLKAALKAKNRGDYDRSQVYFQKAIEAALSLPPSQLDPDPLEKLSGIYIAFAAMLESQGSLLEAYTTLRAALELYGETPLTTGSAAGEWTGKRVLSSKDHIRAIGLSQKLGQMALDISSGYKVPSYPSRPGEENVGWVRIAESHLEGALTEMLKLGLKSPSAPQDGQGGQGSSDMNGNGKRVVAGRDVLLPPGDEAGEIGRVDKRGLGMTMESLSEVYARQGKYDLAGQLLLQTVSLLLPPSSPEPPSLKDQCQAAMLMTTISSYALHPTTPKSINVASSWSLKALSIAEKGLESWNKSDPACILCGRAKSVGLYNLGMLAEMQGDIQTAQDRFGKSLQAAKEYGFNQGKREAGDAIKRIQSRSGV